MTERSRVGWRALLSFVAIVLAGIVLALAVASGTLYLETLVLANDAALWIWWGSPIVTGLIVVIIIGIFTARRYGRRTIRL